jgi:hypothetical protein
MDEETDSNFRKMQRTLIRIQAKQLSQEYLLFELMRDVSSAMQDRRAYLSELFERISARADQSSLENELHPLIVAFREEISEFFAKLTKTDEG